MQTQELFSQHPGRELCQMLHLLENGLYNSDRCMGTWQRDYVGVPGTKRMGVQEDQCSVVGHLLCMQKVPVQSLSFQVKRTKVM